MTLIFDQKDYFNELLKIVDKKPTTIFMSSMGIYAGITGGIDVTKEYGYKNMIHDFLDSVINVKNVYIIIGVSPFYSCNGTFCDDCYCKYVKSMDRLLDTANYYPKFKWRFNEELHEKYIGFMKGTKCLESIMGSRNLSDSNWREISIKVNSSITKELFKRFNDSFTNSKQINQNNIDKLLCKYSKAF